jgi:hypothetical protein
VLDRGHANFRERPFRNCLKKANLVLVPTGNNVTRDLPGSDAISLTRRDTIFIESPTTGFGEQRRMLTTWNGADTKRARDRLWQQIGSFFRQVVAASSHLIEPRTRELSSSHF